MTEIKKEMTKVKASFKKNVTKEDAIELIQIINADRSMIYTHPDDTDMFCMVGNLCYWWDTIELVARDVQGFDVITLTEGNKKFVALGHWNKGIAKVPV